MKNLFLFLIAIPLILISCNSKEKNSIQFIESAIKSSQCEPNENGWTVSNNNLIQGGTGQDEIPALDNPNFISVDEVDFLTDEELVIGVRTGNQYKAYPHRIMDKHEVVNEILQLQNSNTTKKLSITFCPLVGAGVGFLSDSLEFGVSGELYNSNLVMYDRNTESRWSQMLMLGIKGPQSCEELSNYQVVETSWKNWKSMFPDSKVLSLSTGFGRNYNLPLSSLVNEESTLFFDVSPLDTRLNLYERVHGILQKNSSITFPISKFTDEVQVLEINNFEDIVVVAGSKERNFAISFFTKLDDGTTLHFEPIQNSGSIILKDLEEGNLWNIYGEAVEGNRKGQQLRPTTSFIGYWFAWSAFYPRIELFSFEDEDG